jgi:hypothetical protein
MGFGFMTGFISHLYNLLLHFTNHYLFSSLSSSTAASRDSLDSQLTARLELRNSTDYSESESESESDSYVTTDGQSWNKAPIWGLRLDSCYCQTVTGLLMCGDLSDERTGLSFTTAAGHRQRSHSWVRVPWHSRPYFTVSD